VSRIVASKFQFSIQQLLGSVTFMCIAMRLGILMLAVRFEPMPVPLLACLAFCTAGGAAVGCIEGRLIKGALWGLAIGFVVSVFMFPGVNAARE
jgi:hypothetical protein